MRRAGRGTWLTAAVAVLVLLGCDAAIKPVPSPSASASIQAQPAREGLAALGYLDNMLAREQSGDWTPEVAILKSLRMLVSEDSQSATLLQRPLASEDLTGIIAAGREYLSANPSSPVAADVRQILEFLVFDDPQLSAMTVDPGAPAPTINPTPSRLPIPTDNGSAAPSLQQGPLPTYDTDCARFFRHFSIGSGNDRCVATRTASVAGTSYRVFWPAPSLAPFGWDDSYRALVDQAVSDSLGKYLSMGAMPKFDIVLSVNLDVPGGGAAIFSGDRCAVMLYTDAQRLAPDAFKQLVAQQLGHCFQAATFPEQGKAPYEARRWREDGLAAYLGSVVYPAANAEWQILPVSKAVDESGSLLEWSAASFPWWQFLANKAGWPAVASLVRSLPSSGDVAAQAAALARGADIATTYEAFAKAYVDGTIADTSGAMLPTRWTPTYEQEQSGISAPGVFAKDDLLPFQMSHRLLVVAGKANLAFDGATGTAVTARTEEATNWEPLPSSFPESCTGDNRLVLLTYSTAGNGPATATTTVASLTDSGCN